MDTREELVKLKVCDECLSQNDFATANVPRTNTDCYARVCVKSFALVNAIPSFAIAMNSAILVCRNIIRVKCQVLFLHLLKQDFL
jgi:hypothetical protein